MTIKTKDEFIHQYTNMVLNANAAMRQNDYKENNRIVKKFIKMREKYKKEDFFNEAINELMDYNDEFVLKSASSTALKYGINVKKAEKLLNKLKHSKNKVVAFEAEMTLKVYCGYYPGQTL